MMIRDWNSWFVSQEKKRSKIPYRNISHADDCELSCVDDVTWEHTYFFLKLWVDYDFATDDDDAVRWIYSFFSRTVVDYGKIMSFIKIHTVVNDSYLGV